MQLYYNKLGSDPRTIIILHGLFGSHKNWYSVSRELSENYTVYIPDARNHGDSPHAPGHSLQDLTLDLFDFIKENNILDPVIIGHSMGGHTAMHFALKYPDLLKSLIVVDIAPRRYSLNHDREFLAMEMDLSGARSREEVDRRIETVIPEKSLRQFLAMNLIDVNGVYQWKINVPALKNSTFINEFPENPDKPFVKPVLFFAGGLSTFIKQEDDSLIEKFFPSAEVVTIVGADHWLHYTAKDEFLRITYEFLLKSFAT